MWRACNGTVPELILIIGLGFTFMLISIKQALLILAVISWSCLTKQSILEAFTLHLWRKPRTFHTCALHSVAEEEAFRERVSRQTRQEQQWGKCCTVTLTGRAIFHTLSSLYSKTLIRNFSCVFSTSPPKPSWNSSRRDFSLVCNQVAHQQCSGAIVNFSLSFCLSAESCQIPIYHLFKYFSAQPAGPASLQHYSWNTMSFFLLLWSNPAIK